MIASLEKGTIARAAAAVAFTAVLIFVAFNKADSPETEAMRDQCYVYLADGRAWSLVPGDERVRIAEVCNTFPSGLAFSKVN